MGQMEYGMRVLICVAVALEARPLRRQFRDSCGLRLLVTGMGPIRARQSIHMVLQQERPHLVLTCGLAGGLNPALAVGEIVFDADPQSHLNTSLQAAGAKPARFYGAAQVIATAAAKQLLWHATGADVVDMESQVIRTFCREQSIPSATVRIISDTAQDDLPLDFNQFMAVDQTIATRRIAWYVLRHPGKLGALLRFQRQCQQYARVLAHFLEDVLEKSERY